MPQAREFANADPGERPFAHFLPGEHNVPPAQRIYTKDQAGNVIAIIDHGEGFMSLYGNNEALFRQVGDRLGAGETIASVGNSGGNPDSGLYFELRHKGKPFDPLPWVNLK